MKYLIKFRRNILYEVVLFLLRGLDLGSNLLNSFFWEEVEVPLEL